MTKITTREQYEWAKGRVEELFPNVHENTPSTDPASIELELLSNLVADYSEEVFDIGEPSLKEVLKLRMHELGISQKDLANMLEISASRVNDYFMGRAEPTLKTAKKIYQRLHISPAIILGN